MASQTPANICIKIALDRVLRNADVHTGGIPPILGAVLFVWAVLLVIFLILRHCAPTFSRAALATNNEYKSPKKERNLSFSTMVYEDKHWYTWYIHFFFKLRHSDIRMRAGPDASLYLSLIGHLTILSCVLCFISLVVVLPVNYLSGNLAEEGYPRTTIANINPEAPIFWLHTALSIVYLGITLLFMVHYVVQLGEHQQEESNHTVAAQFIPLMVHREDILQHLQEAMPDAPIADVQMAYDVKQLTKLHKKLKPIAGKLKVTEVLKDEAGITEKIKVGWTKICCCCKRYLVDAKSYYETKQSLLRSAIQTEKEVVKNRKRLNVAFITFVKERDAKRFYESYKFCRRRPRSSISDDVKSGKWWIEPSPFPTDMKWQNLSVTWPCFILKFLIINFVIVVFIFFFSTPAIVIAGIEEIHSLVTNNTSPDNYLLDNTSASILYLVIFIFFVAMVPPIVGITCKWETYWTKSLQEQMVIRKTFIYLVLMLVIVPSIGVSSIDELFFQTIEEVSNKIRCSFLPRNGAFIVTYVLSAAFLEPPLNLLRLDPACLYAYRRHKAKTQLQREIALKKAASSKFPYGKSYSFILATFSMSLTYSLVTPLVMPFGMLFMIFSYYVDRYNIYYVCKPAPFTGRQYLHRSAVNFAIVGAVLLQASTLFFSLIRLGTVDPRTIVMMIVLFTTIMICIDTMLFGWCKFLFPSIFKKFEECWNKNFASKKELLTRSLSADDKCEETAKGAYIPPLLRETPSSINTEYTFGGFGYHSFGSTDQMGRKSDAANGPDAVTVERNAKSLSPFHENGQKSKSLNPSGEKSKKSKSLSPSGEDSKAHSRDATPPLAVFV